MIIKKLLKFYYKSRYRMQVKHLEAQPQGSVLYTPIFSSAIDPVLAALFLPGEPRLALPRHHTVNWPKWLLRVIDPILLDANESDSLREFIHLLKGGRNGIFFPEERQSPNGLLGKLHRSLAMIAEQSGVPLVPVKMSGAEHTRHARSAGNEYALLKWVKITIVVGKAQKLNLEYDSAQKRRKETQRQIWHAMRDFKCDAEWRRETLFHSCLRTRQQWGGGHLAVIEQDGLEIPWNQLLTRIILFTDIFKKYVQQKERVGCFLPNSGHAVSTFFGIQRCGAIPAMLNYSVGANTLLACCKTAHIKHVVTSRRFLDAGKLAHLATALEEDGIKLIYLEDEAKGITTYKRIMGYVRALFSRPEHRPGEELDIAVILFTSGSEGSPKGVALSHANVQANATQMVSSVHFSSKERVLSSMPMFHSFGLCSATLAPLIVGMPVVLYPTPLHFKVIPSIAYTMRCTIMLGSNAFLNGYAKSADPLELCELETVACGGDRLKENTYNLWLNKFGVRIVEGYGVTECSPVVSINDNGGYRFGSVGHLLPCIKARLKPVEGVLKGGSLQVSGPNVMCGYLSDEEPSGLRVPQDGWYDTGDIVSIDDEELLTIEGRLKRFAKIGGEMLSLAAIEEAIQQNWPDCAHAVISIPDETRGEVLLLVTEQPDLTREELRVFFKEKGLPDIALPKQIFHVQELPRVGIGKADYIKIKSMVLAGELK